MSKKDGKMKINWFPGHMTKALRTIEVELKLADMVIYCLDARAPKSSLNEELEKRFANKPFIFVLNKADLADEKTLNEWKAYFDQRGLCILLDAKKTNSTKIILTAVQKLHSQKLQNQKQKGISKPIRAMVVGIPNCGKSTIINNLASRRATAVGNKPGITRGKQWIRVSNEFEVLDTPGTLWPNLENQVVAQNLALIGSIKDDVVDLVELSEVLKSRIGLSVFEERYGASSLDAIAKKRGFLQQGGVADEQKAAKAVIDDFRAGRLGRHTLEHL